jgi:phospholipase/carboxylesterase
MPPFGADSEVQPVIERNADRVAALVDEVTASRPTRGKAVVTGFSQGGIMSFALAVRHPERVHGAVPVSGTLLRPGWPGSRAGETGGAQIRALHGDSDQVIEPLPARRAVVKLRTLGFDAKIRLYRGVPHQISQAMRADLFTVLGAMVRAAAAQERFVDPLEPCDGACPGESMDSAACSLCAGAGGGGSGP